VKLHPGDELEQYKPGQAIHVLCYMKASSCNHRGSGKALYNLSVYL